MPMDVRHITLDVSKQPTEQRIVRVGEKDMNGTTLVIAITDHGEPLLIGDLAASLLVKFSEADMYEIAGTASGSTATFTINAESMQPGRTDKACVQLAGDDFILSTGRFELEVLESAEVN